MEIDFTLTIKHYWKVCTLILFYTNVFFIYISLFIGLLIFSLLIGGNVIYAFGYLPFAIIVYAIVFLLMQFIEKNRGSFLKTHLSFNDENVVKKTAITEKVYKWDALKKWDHIGGLYILYPFWLIEIIIPESDISNNDIPAFEQMLETKIGVPKSRTWSWILRGALFFTILLSLAWLFVVVMFFLAPEQMDKTIIGIIVGGTLILMALFVTEFYFILRGKKSGNKTMTKISSVFLSLTMVLVIFLLIMSFVPFS